MDEDSGSVIGLAFYMMVIAGVILAIMAVCSIGALIGAGFSIKNYVCAFADNVHPHALDEADLAAESA